MPQVLKFWMPAVAGMVCLGLGAGLLGVYGFFVAPLSEEFGVGAAVLNVGPVALLLVPGFVAPVVGRLADRLPIRRVLLTGVTVAMLALVATSFAPTLALAAMCFCVFAAGVTGYGPVVVNGLMVKLYPGREARALAIVAIGISVATATLPPAVGFLLEVTSWRTALAGLALVLLVLLWLVIVAGVPGAAGVSARAVPFAGDRAFYRRPEFWLVGLCVALAFNVSIVLSICYPPHFMQAGYSAGQAGLLLAFAGFGGLIGKAVIAWLGDAGRHRARAVTVGLLLVQVVGLGVLLQATSLPLTLCALGLLGFGGGAFIPMHPYLNSRYFDAAINSQVNGAQMPLFLPFGLLGAPLAGWSFDRTGSYDTALAVLAAVLCVAALLALRLPTAGTHSGR